MSTHPDSKGSDILGALSRCRVISLSHPLSPAMPHWPGDPPTEFQTWCDLEKDHYFLRRVTLGEHSGTHLTAPASYYRDGRTVDQYDAGDLFCPAVVVDAREQCSRNPDYALSVGDVLAWEKLYGRTPPDSLVLMLTGWSEHWADPAAYLGVDSTGGLHFPGFGYEAAALLVSERGVAGLGTDTAGIEPGTDSRLSISRLVLEQPRILLENLAHLHLLPATETIVVVGVVGLMGGSGSPAAVTAFVPAKNE